MPNFIKDPQLDPYMIQIDDNNYSVVKNITVEKSGKSYQQTLAFCSNLSSAVQKIAKDATNSRDYDSIKEYVETFEKNENRIKNLLDI